MKPDPVLDRRAKLAFGIALICGLFVAETLQAHRVSPSPASPFIWAALGSVAAGALAYGVWCHRKARRDKG
jgi:hypothetical protein